MKTIHVITGVRFKPEHFLERMAKSKKLSHLEISHVNTIYSLCWVFQFRVALPVTKRTTRYAGYYGGFEESSMVPGKLRFLPAFQELEVEDSQILAEKLTEEEALCKTWEYNKMDIIRKFRSLNAPPQRESYQTERLYKPLYVMRFYNKDVQETKYKVLDSLTGDLEDILLQ
ncbi:MAG: hypothetical protein HFF49_07220 [Lawsonibacter sp.]|jgi:hypothetical protein|nr:hypothetical protein [Lawsonibacter sp.]